MYKYRELKTGTAYIEFRSDQSKFLNPLSVIHFYIVIFSHDRKRAEIQAVGGKETPEKA